jgi:hypothetical protein
MSNFDAAGNNRSCWRGVITACCVDVVARSLLSSVTSPVQVTGYLSLPVMVYLLPVEVSLLLAAPHHSREVLVVRSHSSWATFLGRPVRLLLLAQVTCPFLLPGQLVDLSTLHPRPSCWLVAIEVQCAR